MYTLKTSIYILMLLWVIVTSIFFLDAVYQHSYVSIIVLLLITTALFIALTRYLSIRQPKNKENEMFQKLESGQYEWKSNNEIEQDILTLTVLTDKIKDKVIDGKNKLDKNKNIEEVYLNCPQELIIPIHQYLIFFKEFVEKTKAEILDFNVQETTDGLKISTQKEEVEKVKIYLNEYIEILKSDINNLRLNVSNPDLTEIQADILINKLENQVASFKNSIRTLELENHLLKKRNQSLEEDKQYFKQLTLKHADKETTIHNIVINDGEQQIADKVINQNKKT